MREVLARPGISSRCLELRRVREHGRGSLSGVSKSQEWESATTRERGLRPRRCEGRKSFQIACNLSCMAVGTRLLWRLVTADVSRLRREQRRKWRRAVSIQDWSRPWRLLRQPLGSSLVGGCERASCEGRGSLWPDAVAANLLLEAVFSDFLREVALTEVASKVGGFWMI